MLQRGDVYLISIDLPDRQSGGAAMVTRKKYVVVLRGDSLTEREPDVPFVIVSTDRRAAGESLRNFEVSVGTAEGFHHESIIDCRWVYTRQKSDFPEEGFRFKLKPGVMRDMSLAVFDGLQLYP